MEEIVARTVYDPGFRAAMQEAVECARELFFEGLPLAGWWTGVWRSIWSCSAAAACGCSTRSRRRITTCSRGGRRSRKSSASVCCGTLARAALARGGVMPALAESYAYCRSVARKRAKNFYYSFLLLPPEQSNAMCAIYAFMRYCDDLSDEPGASP